MIDHLIHYFNDGFTYTWQLQLPYRLHKGDLIENEVLDTYSKLCYDKVITDEYITFSVKNDHFEVDYIEIDASGWVCAWLKLPDSK